MEDQTTTNERLASLEAKLEFLKELLKEIRDDVKNSPTRSEYDDLKERVVELEKETVAVRIKVYAFSAIISLLCSSMGVYLIQHLVGK